MRRFGTSFLFVLLFLVFIGFPQPASSQDIRGETLIISFGSRQFEVELYDSNATDSLLQSLPQTIDMSAWGGEFYGRLGQTVNYDGDKQKDVFEVGEVALWPSGNALCIFFGPTPASVKDEPRMASPGVAFGKIKGNTSALKGLGGMLKGVTIDIKK